MKKKNSPYVKIFISFAAVILFGTLLLMLPISTKDRTGLSFINALFTSTSSVCVTGLTVIPNVGLTLSVFGKIVMAVLVEIGGLSFLTFAIFIFIILGLKIGITERFLMREALNQNSVTGIIKLIKIIVLISFSIQFVGFVANCVILAPYYENFGELLGVSAFHAVSSFNNAGFDIFGRTDNMFMFKDNFWLNLNTMLLITLGGIGFIVIYDVVKVHSWRKFSLHTKIVLVTSISLIIFGTLIFKLPMYNEITWLQAVFQSVSTRTAGFATMDMATLSNPTFIGTLALMFIGASPSSTGGGIKTTTFFVAIITIISYARGRSPKVFNRQIASQSAYKSFSLIVIALIVIVFATIGISIAEPTQDIRAIMLEVFSAFGTVGLSMSLTPLLTSVSKIILCLLMLFGRVGPLTIMSMWNDRWLNEPNDNISYVEEKIIVG